ncbi:hypothetical protein E4U21_004208 [Claviceps maximensis]|nr:hypothetical protein E4U21_004208 [Claviceps maximensis]
MSGYGYGPPPPPPPPPSGSGYGHSSVPYSSQGQSRGGSGGSQASRGRGGQYPRPRDYHAPPAVHYDYASQPFSSHHASYGAPHAPVTYPPHTSQWGSDHIGHAPHGTHSHVPAPLASSNYHPNYAPPPFPSASQNPQPSPYGPGQPYGQSYQGHAAAHSTHWSPPGPPQPSHHSGHRGRVGYGDRGGYKPSQSGGPSRQGYDPEPLHSASSYGQPFLHDPRAIHYPPPAFPYAGPPATPLVSHPENHFSHQSRRGRGNSHHRDGGTRGRSGHHNSTSHHGKSRNNNHAKAQQKEHKAKVEPPLGGKKKKRKVNTLGLTPGADSETEDDEGEEKALTELIGTETLQISDVSAFLAERRKNYPTKARVDAKKAASAAQKGQNETTDLEKQADRLRKQLAKVEFSIKRKREQGDEGDDMRDPVANPSDDDKPEVMSSRVKPAASSAASAKKADVSRHCKYYSTGGTCGKKGKCRFVHDPEVRNAAIKEREANNGRMTIQQRLILNDKEQEDLAVLQSIQYIRQKGLIEEVSKNDLSGGQEEATTQENSQDQKSAKRAPATSGSSVLPPGPASLPALPPKKKPNKKSNKKPSKKSCIPSQTSSASLVVPSADSASTEEVKSHGGLLSQPSGSSNGDNPKEG